MMYFKRVWLCMPCYAYRHCMSMVLLFTQTPFIMSPTNLYMEKTPDNNGQTGGKRTDHGILGWNMENVSHVYLSIRSSCWLKWQDFWHHIPSYDWHGNLGPPSINYFTPHESITSTRNIWIATDEPKCKVQKPTFVVSPTSTCHYTHRRWLDPRPREYIIYIYYLTTWALSAQVRVQQRRNKTLYNLKHHSHNATTNGIPKRHIARLSSVCNVCDTLTKIFHRLPNR